MFLGLAVTCLRLGMAATVVFRTQDSVVHPGFPFPRVPAGHGSEEEVLESVASNSPLSSLVARLTMILNPIVANYNEPVQNSPAGVPGGPRDWAHTARLAVKTQVPRPAS